MSQTLEECQAENRLHQANKTQVGNPMTYDQESQNAVWQDPQSKERNDEYITECCDENLPIDFTAIEQDCCYQNVVLDEENDVFEVIHPSVSIREIVQGGHRITDHFDRQRFQRHPKCTLLSINCQNLRKL